MYFRRNPILAILDVSLMGDGNGVLARVGTLSPVERPDVEIITRTPQAKSYLEPEVCHWSND